MKTFKFFFFSLLVLGFSSHAFEIRPKETTIVITPKNDVQKVINGLKKEGGTIVLSAGEYTVSA